MKKHFIAGWGGYPIIGTPEQIVDGLITMSKMGLDGTLLNCPRYIDDQHWFKNNVYPLVKQARPALTVRADQKPFKSIWICRLDRDRAGVP